MTFATFVRQRLSLCVLVAALFVIAIAWSSLLFVRATHQTLDQRVQHVASQLKCPVCQGESVADSPSVLAQQMRSVIREKLQQGQSEDQIIQSFVQSYGQQILWSPPWQGFALLAWLVPILLFLGGVVIVFAIFRAWRRQTSLVNESAQEMPLGENEGVIEEAREDEGDELARYRAQLEADLANEDVLFASYISQREREERP